jgi:spore coat protein CotH
MSVTRLGKTVLVLALGAFAVSTILVGCGTAGPADSGYRNPEGSAETYAAILADRYNEVFPDDRVQTVRILMDAADWKSMQDDVVGKVFYRADIWIGDELVQDVAVRTKGSSSLMGAASSANFRAGLKVDFNFFNAERSYHGVQKMVYNNGYSDPTLMKEFLSYELMALMGIPTPRACFADVWVNEAHIGVYTQVQAVDVSFLLANFDDGTGNLYKPEVRAGALDWTEADAAAEAAGRGDSSTTTTEESYNVGGGNLVQIIDRLGEDAGWIPGWTSTGEGQTATAPAGAGRGGGFPGGGMGQMGRLFNYDTDYLTSVGLRTNENYADYSRLYRMLEVLNSDPAQVSTDDLEDVLEVDEVLRFLAVSVALVHLDNYIGMAHNYYLYEDRGKFWIIPWDLNMTFGGFSSGVSDYQILKFYIDEPTAAPVDEYPLIQQLLDEPEYLDTYHSYLQQMVEGPFSVETMTARIHEIADLIRPYVEKDTNMFFTPEDFEKGLTQSLSSAGSPMQSGGGKFIGLAYFVEERTASITAQLSGESPAGGHHAPAPGAVMGSTTTTTVAPTGAAGGPPGGGQAPPGAPPSTASGGQ